MITIKNCTDWKGKTKNITIASQYSELIDAKGLIALPALIDTHVHFRTPGAEYKEDWISGSKAAIAGGVTTVFDMPNNTPPCVTFERLLEKKELINEQLEKIGIPLHYHLYFGADRDHLNEISKVKGEAIGIKVFMGSSTGTLLVDDPHSLNQVFSEAAKNDLIVSVHAEDEATIDYSKATSDPASHSIVRNPKAASIAVKQAIGYAEKYGTKLAILHVSTKEEIEIIRQAKKRGVNVYCEVVPHHLFLDETDYATWGTRAQVNPPLRTPEDRTALWEAINDGTVDFIGTDHAPHTLEEKNQTYPQSPSGIPSIELLLPLLYTAHTQGKLSLKRLIELTSLNSAKIFGLPPTDDIVLIDPNLESKVTDNQLYTKAGWSPYAGRQLKGWPILTIAQGLLMRLRCQQQA